MNIKKSAYAGCCTNQQVAASHRFDEGAFEIQRLNAEDTFL